MPPPDLPGDAPVFDVSHPSEIIVDPAFRNEPDPSLQHGLDRRLGQRLDLDEPLRGQVRLDHGLAPVAFPERHLMVFNLGEQLLLTQGGDHDPASLLSRLRRDQSCDVIIDLRVP